MVGETQKGVGDVEEITRLFHRPFEVHRVANTGVPRIIVGNRILLCRDKDILQRQVEGLVEIESGFEPVGCILHLIVSDRKRCQSMAP